MKKYLTLLVLQFLVLGLTQVNASHVTGEAITLRQLPNGMSVFQIWVKRDCSLGPGLLDTFKLRTTTTSALGDIPCRLVSYKFIAPFCNAGGLPGQVNLPCAPFNSGGTDGSFIIVLYESSPINLDSFSFTPNSWVEFYVSNMMCCLNNYNNVNTGSLNAFLSLKTNNFGKIISKSSLQIKEWPQTTYFKNDSNAIKNSILFSSDTNNSWEWIVTNPKVFDNNTNINHSYFTGSNPQVVIPFPFPYYQRRLQTNTFEFNVPYTPAANSRFITYYRAFQKTKGDLVAILSFYYTTRILSTIPSSVNQELPQFSPIPTPFTFDQTPIIYATPGDTVEFSSSVKNRFSLPQMELYNRLSGEFATPCANPPCATIIPLPGTNDTTIFYQGQNSGRGVYFSGSDSGQLDYKFRWNPGWQHLQYDSTTQNYISRVFPFTFHAANMLCAANAINFQPFFISLYSPIVPPIRLVSAQILPGDSCRVQAAASLDSTPTNANAIGVDFQIYRQKQSTYKMLAYLESSSSPLGTYQRCSANRTMTFNASSASFNVSLTDSSRSGVAAQSIWYRIVNLAYSGNTLVKTTTSQPFQALTTPGQLPVVQVKPDTVCVGVPARLVAVSSNGGQNPTYQWRYNGVVQSSTTDVLDLLRLSANDSVRVEMTSRNGATILNTVSSTVVRPAKIQPLIPRITRQGDSLVSSISMSNQWYDLSTGLLPNDTLYWIKPTAGNFGPYTVVNRQQYCMVNSIDTVSFFPVQVQELTEGFIKLYPQPASSILNILLPENISVQTVEIMDIQGKVIRRLEKAAETNLLILDTQPLSNGMYLIRTWIGGKEIRKKFLVQHP